MPGKGFPPKPSSLKLMEGRPVPRGAIKAEPRYTAGIPVRPPNMSPGAVKVWSEYVASMGPSGVLTLVDGHALSALCEDQAVLRDLRYGFRMQALELKKAAKASGRKISGNAVTALARTVEGHRTLGRMIALGGQIIAREREFGLMPGSRSRVEVAPGPNGRRMDAIEAALCG